jgi:hypothetical protein
MATNTFAVNMRQIRICFLTLFVLCNTQMHLQAQDSTAQKVLKDTNVQVSLDLDSSATPHGKDSLKVVMTNLNRFPVSDTATIYGIKVGRYILVHPYYKAMNKAFRLTALKRTPPETDWIFYLFIACLLFLSAIRLAFPKYLQDIFKVFFNSSIRQKQIREQLIQDPLPSLMLNIFFAISGGLLMYFLADHLGYTKGYNALLAIGFFILILFAVYLVKFLVLRVMGWIFGKESEAETYTFIVLMVNKIAGIIMFPIVVLLAYAGKEELPSIYVLGIILLIILLIYRLIRSYSAIYKGLKINQLHFILFVFAFEVLPILLLYKVLNNLF